MSRASPSLDPLIERFADAVVWVVGDVMLDEYVEGPVGRISPEAPVPVVQVDRRFTRLGGAANVARSIAALGGRAALCGVIGEDDTGAELVDACATAGIDATALGRDPQRQTTRKLRVLGQGQQLLRLDWETTEPIPPAQATRWIDVLSAGPAPAVIVVSDYAKGLVHAALIDRLVQEGKRHGAPVLIDPKHPDPTVYRGATLIKPNLRELEQMAGRSLRNADHATLAAEASQILARAEIETMVLTLGAGGLLVIRRDGTFEAVASTQQTVFDVTGAGDTVLSVLALALAVGSDPAQAAQLANAAAGIAVTEVGTAAVSPDQLTDAVRPWAATKAVTADAIEARARGWQQQGKQVVFTNGCFDLLHAGHLSMLQQCAAQGDVLVVGLNSDASVRRLKGSERPLVPEHERAALVGALDCVDAVVVFDEDTPLALLERVRPDVLVKGQDYKLDEVVGRELVEGLGGRVVLVPLLAERSTTGLVEQIRKKR